VVRSPLLLFPSAAERPALGLGRAAGARGPERRALDVVEHVGAADTLDYDYGRMLERAANAKCMATLAGFEPALGA
jgi:hypothetical protein